MSTRRIPAIEASLINSANSLASWAKTVDRTARTATCRAAADDRFERQVDPEGKLPPDVRAKMADAARRAHFRRMAAASARARRLRLEAAALEAEVAQMADPEADTAEAVGGAA